jgi:hypothetical protein
VGLSRFPASLTQLSALLQPAVMPAGLAFALAVRMRVCVRVAELVPSWAVRQIRESTLDVLHPRHHFHVIRVDAQLVAAQVIDRHVIGDWADDDFVCAAVDECRAVVAYIDGPVTCTVLSAGPLDTVAVWPQLVLHVGGQQLDIHGPPTAFP